MAASGTMENQAQYLLEICSSHSPGHPPTVHRQAPAQSDCSGILSESSDKQVQALIQHVTWLHPLRFLVEIWTLAALLILGAEFRRSFILKNRTFWQTVFYEMYLNTSQQACNYSHSSSFIPVQNFPPLYWSLHVSTFAFSVSPHIWLSSWLFWALIMLPL